MGVKAAKEREKEGAIRVRTQDETGCRVTTIHINGAVEVGTRNGWLCFWTAGREVRVGPFTPEQAEKLSDDLGYEAVK
jgi:hypothetical protein